MQRLGVAINPDGRLPEGGAAWTADAISVQRKKILLLTTGRPATQPSPVRAKARVVFFGGLA
jgi:hypothetical protein